MIFNIPLEDANKCGIYVIENFTNNKKYIGQTIVSFRKRYNQHCNGLAHQREHNNKFQSDYDKYGTSAFKFSIIEILPKDNLSVFNSKEIEYIDKFDTINNGYNLSKGGNSPNQIYKASTKQKKKNLVTEQFRECRRQYMQNRIVSDETRELIRLANIGEKSPVSVLNEAIVIEVKTKLIEGYSLKEINQKICPQIKYSTLSSVAQGRTWAHLKVNGWEEYLKNKNSKRFLTDDEVMQIRNLITSGAYSQSQIAKMYGCYSSTISCIALNKTHR